MDPKVLTRSIEIIESGGTILYPTDTIWGIGCDATNPSAVEAVYRIKNRVDAKSMLVLVNEASMIDKYVREIPSMASEILNISTDPLTIIYPDAINLASNLIAEDGSIGIRICRTAFCQELISRLNLPIVSTSANISGQPPPKDKGSIDPQVIDRVDYFVDIDQEGDAGNKPSPIIKLDLDNSIKIIRS